MAKKFKPTAGQAEVIDVLAHILIMSEIDKNVEGAHGILNHYIKNTLDARQQAIWAEFGEHAKKVRSKLADMMEQDKKHG